MVLAFIGLFSVLYCFLVFLCLSVCVSVCLSLSLSLSSLSPPPPSLSPPPLPPPPPPPPLLLSQLPPILVLSLDQFATCFTDTKLGSLRGPLPARRTCAKRRTWPPHPLSSCQKLASLAAMKRVCSSCLSCPFSLHIQWDGESQRIPPSPCSEEYGSCGSE